MNRKLIIASLSLTCGLLIASVGTTVAWFASGGGLSAGDINITFMGDKELKISLDGNSFEDEVLPYDNSYLEPVSSMYSDKWISKQQIYPTFKSSYVKGNFSFESTYRETNDARNGFLTQEIYLKSNENVIVTIDADQPIITADEITNKNKAEELALESEKSIEELTKNLNSIKDSIRLSILNPNPGEYSYTIIDPYKNGDTILAGPLAMSGTYYDNYTINHETYYELVYGEYTNEDKIVYDDALSEDSKLKDESKPHSCFNAKTRSGVRKFNLEKSLENGFTPAIEKSLTKQQASDLIKIPLTAFEPKKLVVSIYIEGWDLDNTTETMFGSFIANLKFKIAEGRSV